MPQSAYTLGCITEIRNGAYGRDVRIPIADAIKGYQVEHNLDLQEMVDQFSHRIRRVSVQSMAQEDYYRLVLTKS